MAESLRDLFGVGRRAWGSGPKNGTGKATRSSGEARPANPEYPECPFPCYACQRERHTMANCGLLRDRWPLLLEKAGLPRAYWDAMELIESAPAGLEEAYRAVRAYLADIENFVAQGFGLLLQGEVGTSKTTLAVAVAQSYLLISCEEQLATPFDSAGEALRPTVGYVSALDLSSRLFRLDRAERERFEHRLAHVPLLIVDDLGYERPYDGDSGANFVTVFIEALIQERHRERRATLYTTNLGNKELKAIYTQGTIQRLRERNHPILLRGASLRKPFRLPGYGDQAP